MENALAFVAATLSAKGWRVQHLDAEIVEALRSSLAVLDAVGVILFLGRNGGEFPLFLPATRLDPTIIGDAETRLRSAANAGGKDLRRGAGKRVELRGNLAGLVVAVPNFGDYESDGGDLDQCAFIFHEGSEFWGELSESRWRTFVQILGALFLQPVRRRARVYSSFPSDLSLAYWRDALGGIMARTWVPPWDRGIGINTLTMSLDLRKSTFCMEQTRSKAAFALWTRGLVEALEKVCIVNGGIFDKFTGDGVLVHFLEDETRKLLNREPEMAGLICAVDSQRVLGFFLVKLRELLRFDSGLLGAGIGLDIDEAEWWVDRKGNPIVVGRGVVGACRLCSVAGARRINLTNIVYQGLSGAARQGDGIGKVKFESKEFGEELDVKIWQFAEPPWNLGSDITFLEDICREAWSRNAEGLREA